MKTETIYAVKFIETYANPECPPCEVGPYLVHFKSMFPSRMYWGVGSSYTIKPATLQVLNTYTMYNNEYESVYVQFYNDFPPTPTPFKKEVNGWMMPDGKFYECKFQEHNQLATELVAFYYKEYGGMVQLQRHAGVVKYYAQGVKFTTLESGEIEMEDET